MERARRDRRQVKVLVVATDIGWRGGIQRYGSSVCHALVEQGHEVETVKSIEFNNAAVKTAKLATAVMTAPRGESVVWVLHPRLAPVVVPLARATSLPVVVSTYGFENWGRYSYLRRQALLRAGVVTAISKFSMSMMGTPGRGAVLLRPTWGIGQPSRLPMPAQSERKTISFVGRLDDPYKGLETFVDLSSRFHDEEWSFEAAGAGPVADIGPSRGGENLRISANPSDSYLANLYRRSAVVVVPSRASRGRANTFSGGEGFGIVLLEAALAGAVTIASDEGACPETVALLGNGIACAPTADANEEGLRSLLGDVAWREALAVTGVRRADLFSHDRFRDCVARVLQRACAG